MAAKKKDTRSATPAQKKAMSGKRTDTEGRQGFGETRTSAVERAAKSAYKLTGKKAPSGSMTGADRMWASSSARKGLNKTQQAELDRVIGNAYNRYMKSQKKK